MHLLHPSRKTAGGRGRGGHARAGRLGAEARRGRNAPGENPDAPRAKDEGHGNKWGKCQEDGGKPWKMMKNVHKIFVLENVGK